MKKKDFNLLNKIESLPEMTNLFPNVCRFFKSPDIKKKKRKMYHTSNSNSFLN